MMPIRAEQQPIRRTAAERKLVSVMFADIVGSSAMVSGRDPEDADRVLRSVLAVLTGAVERYEGTIGQVLGDGVLALFGAPSALEDHALRACLAAQDIRAAAAADSGFAVRIGIATGEVLAQVIENGVWTDYRTVGECVHLAAKLQQRAEPNSVLLSHETVELVPAGLTVQPVGMLDLAPGIAPHPAFALSSVRARRRTAADLAAAEQGPFVGRERELETLLAAFESACDGVSTLVLLSGEAGIGKSRLVGEALQILHGTGHALLQWPQAPIRRLGEPDDLECVAASLAPLAGDRDRLCRAAEDAAGPLALAAMQDLLGLPVTDRVWSGLQPADRLSAAIDGLVAATVALSVRTPVLALVEDAHWASPVMRRLLDSFSQALARGEGRILLIATTRPEGGKGWMPDLETLTMPLEALRAERVREFLDGWLGCDPSLTDVKTMVAAKSQGVPLYLEESLRALEVAGTIVGTPGRYRLGNPAYTVDLPPSIQGLLASRIDSLGDAPRRTLLNAAVIGPTFDFGLLRRLGPISEADLYAHVAELEEAGFIRRSRVIPNLEYSFRHGLIQEVAYGTITRDDRRALHANVVEALSERREHDLPGRLELLAHHAFRAENWPAAYLYGRHAGRRAVTRSRLVEASGCFNNALTALENFQPTRRNALRRIDLSIELAHVLLPRGVTGVEGQLDTARALALEVGDPIRFAAAASIQAAFEWAHGDVDEALRLSWNGLAALGNKDSLDTRVPLLMRRGGILAEKGHFAEGAAVLDEGRRLIAADPFRHYGLAGVGMVALNSQRTRCFAEMGDADAAVRAGAEAVEIAEDSGNLFSRVYAKGHFAWALLLLGETERSLPLLEEALALCELTRSYLLHPFMMGALGYAHVMMGKHTEGLALIERGMDGYRQDSSRLWSHQVRIWNAEALLHVGQADRAVPAAETALSMAREARRLGYEARATVVLADAMSIARRRDAEVVRMLKDADALARRLSMPLLAQRCSRSLERLLSQNPVAAR